MYAFSNSLSSCPTEINYNYNVKWQQIINLAFTLGRRSNDVVSQILRNSLRKKQTKNAAQILYTAENAISGSI